MLFVVGPEGRIGESLVIRNYGQGTDAIIDVVQAVKRAVLSQGTATADLYPAPLVDLAAPPKPRVEGSSVTVAPEPDVLQQARHRWKTGFKARVQLMERFLAGVPDDGLATPSADGDD